MERTGRSTSKHNQHKTHKKKVDTTSHDCPLRFVLKMCTLRDNPTASLGDSSSQWVGRIEPWSWWCHVACPIKFQPHIHYLLCVVLWSPVSFGTMPNFAFHVFGTHCQWSRTKRWETTCHTFGSVKMFFSLSATRVVALLCIGQNPLLGPNQKSNRVLLRIVQKETLKPHHT